MSRPARTCSLDGCEKKHAALGYCFMHWQRMRRYGSTELPPRNPQDRFWPKVNKNGPISWRRPDLGRCWIWNAKSVAEGYGKFYGGAGQPVWAHRFAFETAYGEIPHGCHIDHLCMVRLCVNPAHLEAVTQAENNRRAAFATMQRRASLA